MLFVLQVNFCFKKSSKPNCLMAAECSCDVTSGLVPPFFMHSDINLIPSAPPPQAVVVQRGL